VTVLTSYDLAEAFLEARQWQHSSSAYGQWTRQRCEALSSAFGVPGKLYVDGRFDSDFAFFLDSTARSYADLRSPFDGLLEAPEGVLDLHREFARRIDHHLAGARMSLIELTARLLETILGMKPGMTSHLDWQDDPGPAPSKLHEDDW
jgi:hypothetical protein